MRFIILCGGRGERFIGARPKPLNRVCGKPVGQWMINSLLELNRWQDLDIIWALNPKLYKYHIEEEITKWTANKCTNTFVKLPFETRDPCETLEIVLNQVKFNEAFICLDNDNIYGNDFWQFTWLTDQAGILVRKMEPDRLYAPRYGFVKITDMHIVDGKEKIMGWGENGYSIGGYWFNHPELCLQWLKLHRASYNLSNGETSLLSLIIKYSKSTAAIISQDAFSIGTPEDCEYAQEHHSDKFGWHHTRIVVDLDNTLVTNPTIAGDYSSSKPISSVVDWVRDKSIQGAEVIVSTARKMKTCDHNIAMLTSKYGADIIAAIKDLELEEQEINLGKPLGDIYLDDNAINPYDSNWKTLAGDWSPISKDTPVNALPTTRKVQIVVRPVEHLFKSGSIVELAGQAAYYKFVNGTSLRKYFPLCYNILEDKEMITLEMENIKGVPASYIWCNGVWGEREWHHCCTSLEEIHGYYAGECNINWGDVLHGYITKVIIRCQNNSIYEELDEGYIIRDALFGTLQSYFESNQAITCIHGDMFMGNIIFTMKGDIKLIDMRGEINGKLTVLGDPNYDWAKLATSFLGMDSIVYNLPERSVEDGLFWIRRMPNPETVVVIALLLMYGALQFYSKDISQKIIERIKLVLQTS